MLKHVPHSKQIDLTSQVFEDDDSPITDLLLQHAIWGLATKRLRQLFEDFESGDDASNSPSFSWRWVDKDYNKDGIGGEPPDDPLTIQIELPLGYYVDEHPTFALTVTECVDNLIDANVGGENGKIDRSHKGAIAVRDALRAQAQRIDDALDEE